MAISVVATGSATVSASRSPAITFGSYTPATNDLVLFLCNNAAAAGAMTMPSGWVNCHPSGGNTNAASDAHTAAAVYHLVTSGESGAVTTTYTSTNLWNSTVTGNVVGIVLRGVDTTTPIDLSGTPGSSTANAATPHILPVLTGASLSSNSQIVGCLTADGTDTWTTPSGWTARASHNVNQGTAIITEDVVTVAGVDEAAVNVTPSAGDEYVTYRIAFTELVTTGAKLGTLTNDFASAIGSSFTSSGGASVVSGQLNLPAGARIDSVAAYDLTESNGYAEFPTTNNASGDPTETVFSLNHGQGVDKTLGLAFRLHNGNIYFTEYVGGVADSTSLTYSSTDHAWLRFRHTGTTVFWDTSPDGSTWTNRRSKTSALAHLVDLYVGIAVNTNTTVAYDDFTRADSTTSAGPDWTNQSGVFGVLSGEMYRPATTAGAATATHSAIAGSDDISVKAEFTGFAGTTVESVLIGPSSSSNVVGLVVAGTQVLIRTGTSWTFAGTTNRATVSTTHVSGDDYELRRVGNVYTGYKNGSSVITWTDSGNAHPRNSSTRICGRYIFEQASVANQTVNWFSIEDLSGATASTVVVDNFNATVGITGTAAASLQPATASLTGVMQPSGTVAATQSKVVAALTGAQTQSGTMGATVSKPTAALTGSQGVAPSGTIASAVQPPVSALTGAQTQSGTVASTIQSPTAALTGTQTQTGTVAASLQPLTASLTGVMQPSGSIAATVTRLAAALTGAQTQTGILAASSQSPTAALTGAMQPSGAIAASVQALTATLTGAQTQSGTIAASAQQLTATLAGAQTQAGTATASVQTLTAAFTAPVSPSGAIISTTQVVTSALTGAQTQFGAITSTLQQVTAALSGQHIFTGAMASTLQPLTATLTGIMQPSGIVTAALQPATTSLSGGGIASGTIATALGPLTAALSGNQPFTGSIATTVQRLTAALSGVMQPSGIVASTLVSPTAALAGLQIYTGTIATALRPLTTALAGFLPTTGTIASTLQRPAIAMAGGGIASGTVAASLKTLTAALAGNQPYTATIAATVQRPTAALTGSQTQTGTVAADLEPLTAALTGAQTQTGTVAATLQQLTAALAGEQPFSGTAAMTMRPLTATLAGAFFNAGLLSSTLRPPTATLTGAQSYDGTIAVTLTPTQAELAGAQTITGTVGASLQPLTIFFDAVTGFDSFGTMGSTLPRLIAALVGYNAPFTFPTSDRTFVIRSESRIAVVRFEQRIADIRAESRTVDIREESRDSDVRYESRLAVVR